METGAMNIKMGKKEKNDKFYTIPEIVRFCLSQIDLSEYTSIVEPSAGAGAFSNLIPKCTAMDIEPEGQGILKQDFLTYDYTKLVGKILVVGNIPFGKQCSLAIRFMRYAMLFADTVAFILPKSFKKQSLQDKVPLNFILVKEVDLPKDSFTLDGSAYDVPCVFQVWERTNTPRTKSVKAVPISGYHYCSKDSADISLRRVGLYAGEASTNLKVSKSTHYFIQVDDKDVIPKIIDSLSEKIWEHNNTVGIRSISKQEFTTEINEILTQIDFVEKYMEMVASFRKKNPAYTTYGAANYKTVLAGLKNKNIIRSTRKHNVKSEAG